MAQIPHLVGKDWQDWADKLLSCHYGPTDYQRIPDHDRGDAGLEGFTRTDGHAFQAYGCVEPISTNARYENQRDKMTEDIGKFVSNQVKIGELLGNVKITRWALLVPHCDSRRLVAHAAAKTEEVLKTPPPYVGLGFQVCVCQEIDFIEARDRLMNAAVRQLEIEAVPPTQEQIAQWTAANEAPSAVLAEKLQRLRTLNTPKKRSDFQTAVLDWYLRGQDVLETLRKHPDIYAKVQKAKSHHEAYLASSIASGLASHELLNETLSELRVTLEAEVRELHRFPSDMLAHEAVADWLLRCPLDFPDED